MKPIILTGDRPTGSLHLGHYVGSLKNRVDFQNTYKQYLIIADSQALTDNFDNPQKVRDNIIEVAMDYLAVGLDPTLNTYFVQSQVPELCELTYYFMNLVTVARLQRNPTIKEEIKQKGYEVSLPAGFFCYPVSQAADILAFNADLIPCGDDQKPMIEQTNEIVRRFNFLYKTKCFKEVQSLIGSVGRLPGTDGKLKMSKSLGNAIFLSDSTDEIRRKVNLMYTDPNHIRVEDPGSVEGNVAFMFLDFFDPNKFELEELKLHYRHGGLGDGVLKKRLIEILDNLIAPIRQKRNRYATDLSFVKQILKEGNLKARSIASIKVDQMKAAMMLKY